MTVPSQIPISVLIPVRNEVKNLGRCLASLAGWAGEIVVVDSQSTDGTIELAESAGASVLQFQYTGGWPKKRQWALGDSCLAIRMDFAAHDADEILTDQIKVEMEQAIRDPRRDGFWLCFRMVFLGSMLRFGDTDLWKLSLFRKR